MITMEQIVVESGQGIRRISPDAFAALQKIARLLDANEQQPRGPCNQSCTSHGSATP